MRNFKELLNVAEETMYCVKEKFVGSLPDKDDRCTFIGTKEDCLKQIDDCNDIDEFGQYISDYMYYMEPSNIIFNINYLYDLFVDYDINDNSFDKACETLKNYLMDEYDEYTDNIDDFNKYKTIKQRNGKISDDIKAITEIKKEYEIYLESKEMIAMSNKETKVIETVNNENKKEVSVMNNEIKENTAEEVALQIVAAIEEAERMAHLTLIERIEDMLIKIETIKYPFNEGYVTKDMMADLISEVMGNRPNPEKKSRDVLIEALLLIHHNLTINEAVVEDKPFIAVGDLAITNDNAPNNIVGKVLVDDIKITIQSIELDTKYNTELAMAILKDVILKADNNSQHNFISHWMLTSAISEILMGYPLKGKDTNGNWVEFHEYFTKEQETIIDKIRSEFLKNSKFIPKIDSGKVKGYHIPAKSLVYGRSKWLNKDCIYKYNSAEYATSVEYHVSLTNGIKNTLTGKVTTLSNDAYEILDSKCIFIK